MENDHSGSNGDASDRHSERRELRIEEAVDDATAARTVRERDAGDTGKRLELDELAREHGVDPADLAPGEPQ